MSDEILEIEEEQEDDLEEINNTIITYEYRRKLIKKISIVFGCIILILITRIFDKYVAFDIVMASKFFLVLLAVATFLAIGIALYLFISRNDISSEETRNTHKMLLNVFDLISVVPVFMAIVSIINAFAISPATVIGQSMEPNFYEGEDILMIHVFTNYDRFDVIVLETDNNEYYLKRIIGLPGDLVEIDHNIIKINGEIIEQEFIEDEYGSIISYTYCNNNEQEVCTFNVPIDSYFVLGDNREHSLDSRSNLLGYVKKEQIYGTVIYKFENVFRGIFN